MIIANTDGDNDCQGHDKSGLTLQDWLFGISIADFGLMGILGLFGLAALATGGSGVVAAGAMTSTMIWSLFKFVWWIVGIVIVSRSHGECIAKGEDIGVMTLFDLIWTIGFLWVPCCCLAGGVK